MSGMSFTTWCSPPYMIQYDHLMIAALCVLRDRPILLTNSITH